MKLRIANFQTTKGEEVPYVAVDTEGVKLFKENYNVVPTSKVEAGKKLQAFKPTLVLDLLGLDGIEIKPGSTAEHVFNVCTESVRKASQVAPVATQPAAPPPPPTSTEPQWFYYDPSQHQQAQGPVAQSKAVAMAAADPTESIMFIPHGGNDWNAGTELIRSLANVGSTEPEESDDIDGESLKEQVLAAQ